MDQVLPLEKSGQFKGKLWKYHQPLNAPFDEIPPVMKMERDAKLLRGRRGEQRSVGHPPLSIEAAD